MNLADLTSPKLNCPVCAHRVTATAKLCGHCGTPFTTGEWKPVQLSGHDKPISIGHFLTSALVIVFVSAVLTVLVSLVAAPLMMDDSGRLSLWSLLYSLEFVFSVGLPLFLGLCIFGLCILGWYAWSRAREDSTTTMNKNNN
jgi:hypothetical protein